MFTVIIYYHSEHISLQAQFAYMQKVCINFVCIGPYTPFHFLRGVTSSLFKNSQIKKLDIIIQCKWYYNSMLRLYLPKLKGYNVYSYPTNYILKYYSSRSNAIYHNANHNCSDIMIYHLIRSTNGVFMIRQYDLHRIIVCPLRNKSIYLEDITIGEK